MMNTLCFIIFYYIKYKLNLEKNLHIGNNKKWLLFQVNKTNSKDRTKPAQFLKSKHGHLNAIKLCLIYQPNHLNKKIPPPL